MHLYHHCKYTCCTYLLKECFQYHGYKGDNEMTFKTYSAINKRIQISIVWVKTLGIEKCLPPIKTKSHENEAKSKKWFIASQI